MSTIEMVVLGALSVGVLCFLVWLIPTQIQLNMESKRVRQERALRRREMRARTEDRQVQAVREVRTLLAKVKKKAQGTPKNEVRSRYERLDDEDFGV